jgi:hypothetical protein
MRNVVPVVLALLFAFPVFLSAQEQEEALPGTLTVFFPEGAGVVSVVSLEGGDSLDVRSGSAVMCQPGIWHLQITHPDYDVYQETIEVRSEEDVIVLPQMALSRSLLNAKAEALRTQRAKVLQARRTLVNAALMNGVMSLVSVGIIGGLEWMLFSQKQGLSDEYTRYRTASAADAPGIWESILGMEADIQSLRTYETIAIGAAGVFALAGTTLLVLTPSTELLDRRIKALSGSESK